MPQPLDAARRAENLLVSCARIAERRGFRAMPLPKLPAALQSESLMHEAERLALSVMASLPMSGAGMGTRAWLASSQRFHGLILDDVSPSAKADLVALVGDVVSAAELDAKATRITLSHKSAVIRAMDALGIHQHLRPQAYGVLRRSTAGNTGSPMTPPADILALGVLSERLDRWRAFASTRLPATARILANPDDNHPDPETAMPSHVGLFELDAVHERLRTSDVLRMCEYAPAYPGEADAITGIALKVESASRLIACGGRMDVGSSVHVRTALVMVVDLAACSMLELS
jgi:hypothetical protein